MDKQEYFKKEKSLQTDLIYARNQLKVYNLALKQYFLDNVEDDGLYYHLVEKIKMYRRATEDCENLLLTLHKDYIKALEKGEVK